MAAITHVAVAELGLTRSRELRSAVISSTRSGVGRLFIISISVVVLVFLSLREPRLRPSRSRPCRRGFLLLRAAARVQRPDTAEPRDL